jgi:hypothetical protein
MTKNGPLSKNFQNFFEKTLTLKTSNQIPWPQRQGTIGESAPAFGTCPQK